MDRKTVATLVVGIIAGAALTVCIGAQVEHRPQYQITASGDTIFVLDNETNRISLLYKKRVDGSALIKPDWPWANDQSFSLEDALTLKNGSPIKPGEGR